MSNKRDQNANRWLVWFMAVAGMLIAIWLVSVMLTYW